MKRRYSDKEHGIVMIKFRRNSEVFPPPPKRVFLLLHSMPHIFVLLKLKNSCMQCRVGS